MILGSTIAGIVPKALCYHRGMGVFGAVLLVLFASAGLAAADDKDPVARARALYNQRHFDAAITAADQARAVPARSDSGDLIAARAYLERFRESAASDDLTHARERLRRLDPHRLGARERVELLVGLGEALYFDGAFGAAADMFNSLLAPTGGLPPDARERVLDWWASAIDRDARPRTELERQGIYQRIRDRMHEEITARPGSTAAAYWQCAAARGQGDLQAAWDAALAGWVRATLASDRGAALRGDLDGLMQRAIIPERSKMLGLPPETLRLEWERFKERWTK
jgi:hypothetical protein